MSLTSEDQIYYEQVPNLSRVVKSKAQKLWRPTTITNRFPIIGWLPKYKPKYLINDFIAGFTVGLTTIPQAIAYGVVAGLEPQYGLYSAFMGCFTYIVFGSCKDVTIATTAIMAIMVHPFAVLSPDFAVLLCFLVGCIILIFGLLNLGVLVRFISVPVITGFTIAAAITIGSAQINNLFGIASPSNEFVVVWKHFFTHLPSSRWPDAVLGVGTLTFLILMKETKRIGFGNKIFWKYLSLSRNALGVIFGTFLAYILSRDGTQPFRVTGKIIAGLPPFKVPPFNTNINGTDVSFSEMISEYGVSLGFVPMVAILEIVAIAKAFSKGKIVNASQEMVALGMCNIMGSFVSSMPVTGSFTRTAINNASGVQTPLGGAVTGALVLLALAFLTQTFYFIPKTTLSAVIIAAMISLVEADKVRDIWKSKKFDLFPFLVTLFTCLFWSLEYGILCGVVANLIFILYKSAIPKLEISVQKVNDREIAVVNIKQSLDYASAEYLKEKIVKFVSQQSFGVKLVVLEGKEINGIDYTVAANLVSLKEDLKVLSCGILFWRWNLHSCGVVCRLNTDIRHNFRDDDSLADIVSFYFDRQTRSDSVETIQCDT